MKTRARSVSSRYRDCSHMISPSSLTLGEREGRRAITMQGNRKREREGCGKIVERYLSSNTSTLQNGLTSLHSITSSTLLGTRLVRTSTSRYDNLLHPSTPTTCGKEEESDHTQARSCWLNSSFLTHEKRKEEGGETVEK